MQRSSRNNRQEHHQTRCLHRVQERSFSKEPPQPPQEKGGESAILKGEIERSNKVEESAASPTNVSQEEEQYINTLKLSLRRTRATFRRQTLKNESRETTTSHRGRGTRVKDKRRSTRAYIQVPKVPCPSQRDSATALKSEKKRGEGRQKEFYSDSSIRGGLC